MRDLDQVEVKIKALLLVIPMVFLSFIASYCIYLYLSFDPGEINFISKSSKIFDRDGNFLWEISDDNAVRNTPVDLDTIPLSCIEGIIAVEDKTFWQNIGVDLRGLLRLGVSLVTNGSTGGGSTITQQVIKNANQRIYNRNPSDKLTEIIQSIKLTQYYSKEEILEMYLNNIYFGSLNYGIESASNDYFNKSVTELNTAECAYLAGIPQWPGVYNPYGEIKRGKERQERVLKEMLQDGYISEQSYNSALNVNLEFKLEGYEIRAPHFVQFLRDNFKNSVTTNIYSQNFTNLNKSDSYKIYTTYSYDLHTKTLSSLSAKVNELKPKNVNNGAVVILGKNNEVINMIGSVNFFDDSINGKFNSSLGLRQPGTALIPLIYSLALSENYNRTDIINGDPIQLNVINLNGELEEVLLSDPNSTGDVTIERAVQQQLLSPTARMTAILTPERIQNSIISRNVVQEKNNACNNILFLEGCEMSLLNLTYQYSLLKNNGEIVPMKYIESVLKDENPIIFQHDFKNIKNAPNSAGLIITNEILSNQNNFAIVNGLVRNGKDTISIAFNKDYTIGVWIGNTQGEDLFNLNNSEGSESLVREIITYLN